MNALRYLVKWTGMILVLAILLLGQAGVASAQQSECILQSSAGPADYYPMGQEVPTGRNTICVPTQAETGLAVMTGFDPAEYYPLHGSEVPAARNVSVKAIRAEEQFAANLAQVSPTQAETGLAVMTGFDPAEYYPLHSSEVPAARNVSVKAIRAEEQLAANLAQETASLQPAIIPVTGMNVGGSTGAWLGGMGAAVLIFTCGLLFWRKNKRAH